MTKDEVGMEDKTTPRSGVQVIARAAAVLRKLQDHPAGLTLGELAKLLKLPRSTVQRIVEALTDENLVIAASPTRGVRLGPALLALAAATRFEISELARPTLQEISMQCGETVDLSVLVGNKLIFVDQVVGGHRLRAESAIGVSFTLHSTAPGKAMMAAMSADNLDKLRGCLKLTRLTDNTARTWEQLEKELAVIRQSAVALDQEENSPGICAVAMALVLPNGELAAVSIPVPTQRFQSTRTQLEQLLKTHCGKLQQSVGAVR
jgi:DNA-binding IclR family transcriptional regulator